MNRSQRDQVRRHGLRGKRQMASQDVILSSMASGVDRTLLRLR